MEERRKKIIQQIENKKNQAINKLTKDHEAKYANIKNYYQEITQTNLEIIKTLKSDLNERKADDAHQCKTLMDERAKNQQIVDEMK